MGSGRSVRPPPAIPSRKRPPLLTVSAARAASAATTPRPAEAARNSRREIAPGLILAVRRSSSLIAIIIRGEAAKDLTTKRAARGAAAKAPVIHLSVWRNHVSIDRATRSARANDGRALT